MSRASEESRSTVLIMMAMVFLGALLSGVAKGDKLKEIRPGKGTGLARRHGAHTKASIMEIAADIELNGGVLVHQGCSDAKNTLKLRIANNLLVHGLDKNEDNINQARRLIEQEGASGQVVVEQWNEAYLPYIDNFVNVMIVDDQGGITKEEILRVLVPGGIAYSKISNGYEEIEKPYPAAMGEWTHYLNGPDNNAVGTDTLVGPPRRLQWNGLPKWARHHEVTSSLTALVSSAGKIFYIYDEGSNASKHWPTRWALIARDAFNGVVLWKRPIKEWHPLLGLKRGPAYLPRRLVSDGNTVYTTIGGIRSNIAAIDGATGKTLKEYEGTEGTDELIISDGIIFSIGSKDIRRIALRGVRSKSEEFMRDIIATDATTRRKLWIQHSPVLPLTLAATEKGVVFHNGDRVVCLDRVSGDERWVSQPVPRLKSIPTSFAPTLIIHDNVVLFAGGENFKGYGRKDTMTAFSIEDGRTLWTAEHPGGGYRSPEDLLAIKGLVWTGDVSRRVEASGIFKGIDVHTGKVIRTIRPDVDPSWFHHRCHKAKATEKYIITSRAGVEFIDLETGHWDINHWTRGACLYGILPCNGLLYTPPNPCACYAEAKMGGFNALAPALAEDTIPEIQDSARLQKGVDYNADIRHGEEGGSDWPTYRQNASRSAYAPTRLKPDLQLLWESRIGGTLSSPVIADGKIFVAQINKHVVHAIDESTGTLRWRFVAGGRVDSPPTIWNGRVLFGSRDGWVYCLNAENGNLMWRFLAATSHRYLFSEGQLESVWPVHGSVLVRDSEEQSSVYFVAGRSMFLDGGMTFYCLNAETGEIITKRVLNDKVPGTETSLQSMIKELQMPVALADILSCDNKYLYMRSQKFDFDGRRLDIAPGSGIPHEMASAQTGEGRHLFSSLGFLDGTWFHRGYWLFGRTYASGYEGHYSAGKYTPAGRMLVEGGDTVYGFGRLPKYYKWTGIIEYHLFAIAKDAKLVLDESGKGEKRNKKKRLLPLHPEFTWTQKTGTLPVAMALTEESVFIAGGAEIFNEKDIKKVKKEAIAAQESAWNGEKGCLLQGFRRKDGAGKMELKLKSIPVWDGMAVANGKIYLSMKNGALVCVGAGEKNLSKKVNN